jgi:hypothetical protein
MRITTPGNHDEGVTLEVVTLASLELILAPDGEQRIRAVEENSSSAPPKSAALSPLIREAAG